MSQVDKFKAAARDLDCDDDPKRFRERVGKLAVAKPKEEKPKENSIPKTLNTMYLFYLQEQVVSV